MNEVVPKRIATMLMNALKGGVVPRTGLGYIAVGRENEINALLNDVSIIESGGATFRFIVGKYGSGKSFLLQTIRSHVMEKGFVVVDADLSPDRRLVGNKGQGLATYRELIQNMSTKTRPDGGALPLILERWIASVQNEVIEQNNITPSDFKFVSLMEAKIYEKTSCIEGLVHGFEFAKIINLYFKGYMESNDTLKNNALKWLRGEYNNKTEVKQELGINLLITDEDWYEYIKIFAQFMVMAGYKGMLLLIDELVNIYKIPNQISRQYNYEKILTLYNDTLQGKAKYLGIIMSGTEQCVLDTKRGIFSYEALKSILEDSRFSRDDCRDFLAPIIKLQALTKEEMTILIEKLTHIHCGLYNYQTKITENDMIEFIKTEYARIGADSHITPREVIRDYIELLNTLYQYPDKNLLEIINGDDFKYTKSTTNDEEINAEFADFEL